MATKKSVSKKTAGSEPAVNTPGSEPAAKTAAKKSVARKVAAKKTIDVQASNAETATKSAHTPQPTHHDISVQAYLLWERDGRKHGGSDHYWQQAERELHTH